VDKKQKEADSETAGNVQYIPISLPQAMAARELLEALVTTVTFLKNNGFAAHPTYKAYVEAAEAAITKATGGQ
jgi:hypothetical protein